MRSIKRLTVTHVQATIICAKISNLQVRIRSGGHDYEGMSYVSNVLFVIVDMINLRSIDIDFDETNGINLGNQTGWVQAGATLGELYYKIGKTSNTLAFPAGVCLTLGAGGHFSGGGYGPMLRHFGMTIDNIIEAIVVDANGTLLDRGSMGGNLFLGCQWGRGPSFCVIIAWKIKLVRVPDTITVFNVPRSLEQGATDIVLQWLEIATKIDRKLFIRVQPQVQFIGGGSKTVQVSFIGMYLGRATSVISLIESNFPRLGLQPSDCNEMPWVKTHLFWNNLSQTSPIEVLSDYVKDPIPRSGLETIWNNMIEVENVFVQWNPYGGKMSEISENSTRFPHRKGILFMMQYIIIWHDDTDQALITNIKATRDLHVTFTPFVTNNPRKAFFNYRDIDIGTNVEGNLSFAIDFFKDNVNRLLQVKAKVDPNNLFRYEQSIPLESAIQVI
ncbi:hypothetical protein RND81_01G069600 [Saponaria officinalis]|uniref:FAD-binding PCMH-type domain-containing protein n=1 Tax=Saponaria officinalis TaxID=3572 RepID=A0AAW1NH17_SAPOF